MAKHDSSNTGTLPTQNGSPLVLVVDDQPRNLQLVKKVLNFDGYHVVTAESGEEAFRCIAGRRPDLILLDIAMPGMDGFAVCERIKADQATQDIPIIFLSADTEHRSVMTSFSKGGIDYIRKPFNRAELLARVRTHVDLHRSQTKNAAQLEERLRTLDMIAHEWHKPMQRISLFLSKMQDLVDDPKSGTLEALSKEASKTMDRMLGSIEDFLHQQSGDEQSASETSKAIGALTSEDIKSMVGKWYITAKRKLVELALTAPADSVPVEGAPFAVNQIVESILSNAVQSTQQSGRIDAKIFQEKGELVLRVEDDGPGFPAEYLRRKFKPYLRAEGRDAPALGVGLAAAKRIADRMNATLAIGNRPGGGAWVTLNLPLRAAPAAKSEPEPRVLAKSAAAK